MAQEIDKPINTIVPALALLGISLVSTIITVILVILLYIDILKTKASLQTAIKCLEFSLEPFYHTYTPIVIYALIAMYAKCSLDEVKKFYMKTNRKNFVLKTFGEDELSDDFIKKYDSLFMKYGFDGEQALLYEEIEDDALEDMDEASDDEDED